MNKLLQRIVFYIILVCSFNLVYSQNQEEQQSLAVILTQLENRYNVKFSFEPKTIEDIEIIPLKSDLTLNQAIDLLNTITDLKFKILSDRFIAISVNPLKSVQELEEVIVTNFLTKGISKTINGKVNVKTNQFNILPGLIEPDVLQIVQNLPGIISVDERISNLNIRGGTNDQNLVLYEGIRMYQTGHFFGLISAFNPYLTQNIDISKNGTSSKFGDGVSSILAINNSDYINNTTKAGIGGNLLSVDGFAKISLSENKELQLSARRSYTDLIVSTTYDSYFDRIFTDSELNSENDINTLLSLDESFIFYDFNAKFLYDIDDSSNLRVNLLNIYNKLDYDQIFTNSQNDFQESQSTINQVSYGASLTYSKIWSNDFQSSIQAYYSNYNLDAENKDITNAQFLTQENKVEDYGIRLDLNKTINSNTKFNSGYQFNEVGVTNFEDVTNPNFTSLIKEIIRTHAIFGETEYYSNSRNTFLRLGARISYFEKLKELRIEPRFSFNQKISDAIRLEILSELKSQSITQIIDLQQDFFGIEKRRWQLANTSDVPLIRSQQASLGLSYNKNQLLVSIEGYYKNIDNITASSQGFQNQFQFVNDIGAYTVKGIDFLVNKKFQDFSTWLSYTYSTNDYQFEELNSGKAFANTLDLRHVANASITYNIKSLKVALGFNWHSGRPYTKPLTNQNSDNAVIDYNSPNSSRLNDYFRTDISAIYDFILSRGIKAQVGASLWNVFNQNNTINRYYTFDADDNIIQIDNRSLRFTPNFSFRLNF
ncbi:TonB-dependent receptor domain-containing protein [Winogradskyella sp.]|uniref:TonB-dependent receptor domain-containing protein n=1 Tax=Winogradskyella sp. TaxID=1883156 RepID=UPI003F6C2D5F